MKTHISETCQKKEQNKLSREATDERADAQRRFESDNTKQLIALLTHGNTSKVFSADPEDGMTFQVR